jgi:3-hydroxyisobutyrate dehydrogenase
MGSAIADRLRAAGHRLALYDPALPVGGEVASSLAVAARRSIITFLCLPDAAGVEASLPGLKEAAPPMVVDLSSSLPATTRRMAAALAVLGVDFADAPLSGGVAGARAGTLTAMVGGDQDLVRRVSPVLTCFASYVRWAGPVGSGHAIKALNNALSAVSLMGTAEMLVTAVTCGLDEEAAVVLFNRGPARSQNSEVKYPRDVLTRTYAAGFSAGLMRKDLANALQIARERGVAVPLLAEALEAWTDATRAIGSDADFTRFHEVVGSRTRSVMGPRDDLAPEVLEGALAGLNQLALREVLLVARSEGLDQARMLGIVNTSSGRSEATRRPGGPVDTIALAAAANLADRCGVWAPMTAFAARLVHAAPA